MCIPLMRFVEFAVLLRQRSTKQPEGKYVKQT
jgi:hypothetical protein